ncbi:NAD(P)-binding domain protein [Cordyceps fumosorosea ARSEF 2679]|uniref:NAD(P)-binding domain protein n=1 Tax=Cordyceps fumosorosea (strain ARSEF 2679) TaxID=1081104 RepID=A0A168E456_CORFA|nr:NAD(P)-binding domain protein [Cordyceps fumosorosea ARSEF 2679]OAA73353.1 NAD(P)-binding domain protein [Cordyceps fumosorosea ARSEF 2679]
MGFTLPSTDGRVVTVLGGGVLGRRIACAWAASGFDVVIRDPSAEQRIAAVHYCETSFPQYSAHHSPRGSVTATEDLAAAVASAWLVIEAVPEKLPLKVSTLADLESLAPPDALLCSNSSSYKSREMLGGLRRPEETARRVLNMHYYMPPGNRVVELMTCGQTDEAVFPFLVEKLQAVGMHPYVARKESTGLIFNRLWAAIKREVLTILAEGVSTPEEVDKLWLEVWGGNKSGPVAMMDAVGLDTVSFIEQHYISERGLPNTPVDFLKTYIDEGRLGTKSAKGGLLPPGGGPAAPSESAGSGHDDLHAPLLYFLDIGLSAEDPREAFRAGRVLVGASDERPLKPLVSNQRTPDGIDVALSAGKLFWTSMGIPSRDDGSIWSANLDGSDAKVLIPPGSVNTPKQLVVDQVNGKLYFTDREGLRVLRCALDGSALETLVEAGDRRDPAHVADQTRWCVGVAVSPATGTFYWTQKGPSKGSRGRVFRAGTEFREGETAATRTDVEVLLQGLPEPIDLDVDEEGGHLYWTDRGELPIGNSINRVKLEGIQPVRDEGARSVPGKDYELLARNMHEAIGIKLDLRNRHIYTTDLGGAVYRFGLDGMDKKRLYEGAGAFAGIALAYV